MSRRVVFALSMLLAFSVVVSMLSVSSGTASGANTPPGEPPGAHHGSSPNAAKSDRDPCAGFEPLLVPDGVLCTHGPDPAPPGFATGEPVALLRGGVARQAMATVSCDGDGQSGFRVQVLYVHAADVAGRFDEVRLSIQGWAAGMNQIVEDSAAATGGTRRVRFVHDADCQPVVSSVQVSPGGDGSFDAFIADLKKRGFNRTNRIYLAFVDTAAAGYCGIGTVWNDDRANPRLNRSNAGPSYARIDAGCWSADIAAHEVMHTLGGVQHSAPNATGGFHCIDEWDIMCRPDGGSAAMREVCPDQEWRYTRFDCGNDDYFHTNPAPGSYLATHWNTAHSRFLIGSPELPPQQAEQKQKAKKKHGGKHKKGHGGKGKGGKHKRR